MSLLVIMLDETIFGLHFQITGLRTADISSTNIDYDFDPAVFRFAGGVRI
jgi:hypothetical protein